VPFYIRAGKCLPVTCTEVMIRMRRAPSIYAAHCPVPNHARLRISPEVTIALGMNVLLPEDESVSVATEMTASHRPGAGEMDAYERVLGDAMHGDATLFAREDYVEEAWRIVDPAVRASTALHTYEPGSWGPAKAAHIAPPDGWRDPSP
jgi:glucose-6-phosphate 1-dehydrogenase